MTTTTIYLKTTLFSTGTQAAHVPVGVQIIEGTLTDQKEGCVHIQTTRLLNCHAKEISAASVSLQIPLAKIDHILHAN